MSEFTKEDAQRVALSRPVVTSEDLGKDITAKVMSVKDFIDKKTKEQKQMVNIALTSNFFLGRAKELLAGEPSAEDISKATNQHFAQSVRAGAWTPKAGSLINIVIQEETTKNDITGYFIKSMSPLESASPKKANANFFDDEAEVIAIDADSVEADEILGKKK